MFQNSGFSALRVHKVGRGAWARHTDTLDAAGRGGRRRGGEKYEGPETNVRNVRAHRRRDLWPPPYIEICGQNPESTVLTYCHTMPHGGSPPPPQPFTRNRGYIEDEPPIGARGRALGAT